jgi:NAD(P)-dependent dehydrogenase (short-subunit alcohol dehydrogenase family)
MARAAVAHMQPGSAIVNAGSITGNSRQQAATRLLDYSTTRRRRERFMPSRSHSPRTSWRSEFG